MASVNFKTVSKYTVGQRVAVNTGWLMGSKVLASLLGLGSLVIATKFLDGYSFGLLVFLHAYMLFFSEIANLETWRTIIRFGTNDIKRDDIDSLGQMIKFSIKADAFAALLGYGSALLCFYLFFILLPDGWVIKSAAEHIKPDTLKPIGIYIVLYCLLILLRQRGMSIGVLRLFDDYVLLGLGNLTMPFVRFIGAIWAAFSGAGFEGFLLAWFCGSLFNYIFLPLVALVVLHKRRILRPVLKAKTQLFSQRKGLWPFTINASIDASLAAANLHLPSLLVTALFGPIWVGIYKIAEEIARLLSEAFFLLDQAIYPELAKMVTNEDWTRIWNIATRSAIFLLSFGLIMSAMFIVFGKDILAFITTENYAPAVPLASILLPAVSLVGIATPLYPIFYATNKPQLAVYGRGLGVLVYIFSFFVLSYTIGKMAPAWAAVLGHGVAVVFVVLMAHKILKQRRFSRKEAPESLPSPQNPIPVVQLVGESDVRLWSMPLVKWQQRAFTKSGAVIARQDQTAPFIFHIGWVACSHVIKTWFEREHVALMSNGVLIATHGVEYSQIKVLIGQPCDENTVAALGLHVLNVEDLGTVYNKMLRKTLPTYVFDSQVTPAITIMRHQYACSYKGITDFVTKFFWPKPAFYITRLCAALKVTPNMVTSLSLLLMCLAFYYFWNGQWAGGFICGWLMTFLDTVDGKLARTTHNYSKWGTFYDHGIDLMHPPFWYWAWYVGLGGSWLWPDGLTLAILAILIGYWVDRIVEGVFILKHGFHIHIWRPANSLLRFFIARRNPNMFIFMLALLCTPIWPDAGQWGFLTVAAWVWICILFNLGVLGVSLMLTKPLESWLEPT